MCHTNGIPKWLSGKESACSAGGMGLIPGSGRSSGGGNGNPLQYSCLEDSMHRGAWRAAVHGVAKSWTWLSEFHFLHLTHIKSYSTVLWRCTRPRTNTHKRCPFHYRGLECQSRKSRNIWSNRQIWPWNAEWSRAKTNRILPRCCLVQQHKRRLYTWTSPDGQYRNQIDYILCNQRWSSSIQSAKTRLGADSGSDHELFIAKFRLKLNK